MIRMQEKSDKMLIDLELRRTRLEEKQMEMDMVYCRQVYCRQVLPWYTGALMVYCRQVLPHIPWGI